MFTPFYNQLLKRYHLAFGQLFAETILLRNASVLNDGPEAQRFTVPIEYSARDAWLARFQKDSELTQQNSIVLPRYAYEMTGMRYDSSRKLNTLNQRTVPIRENGSTSLRRYFIPTPYVLTFNLYAITRSVEDGQQIVEQITPYFQPDLTQLVRLIPSANILDRMRIMMDGAPQWVDNFEGAGFDTTRQVIITFTFTAHANFYGPIAATPSNIIRRVIVDLYDVPSTGSVVYPTTLEADGLSGTDLLDEEGYFLLDEANTSDVGRVETRARIDIQPDPVDAPAERPVNITSTITEWVDGVMETEKTTHDSLE